MIVHFTCNGTDKFVILRNKVEYQIYKIWNTNIIM